MIWLIVSTGIVGALWIADKSPLMAGLVLALAAVGSIVQGAVDAVRIRASAPEVSPVSECEHVAASDE